MSWFDTSGLANIAKTALKEAQKTIDKALDIKEEDLTSVNTIIDTNPDDFFGTWGITQSGNVKDDKKTVDETDKAPKVNASLWGSFAGSFFDHSKEQGAVCQTKSNSIDSLDDSLDMSTEQFSKSKLVVQHSEDDLGTIINETEENEKVQICKHDKSSEAKGNRLSTISIESAKNSESVDVISSSNTECTTPESDLFSNTQSLTTPSSDVGSKIFSDSLEILPEASLTSPSSVEVIGSEASSKRHSQHTEDFSPMESPWDEKSPMDKASESVEIIPEDQDEPSIAEDTMSYTSMSESTSTTVLDTAFSLHPKPSKMVKESYSRPDTVNDCISGDISLSPDNNFTDAITRAPSRTTMTLSLTQNNQVLIDTQPQSINSDLPDILKKTNIIDIPQDTDSMKSVSLETSTDEGSQSDRTMIASDNLMESSSDTSTTEASSHSTYLKNMIADAMTEKTSIEQSSVHFIDLTQNMLDPTPSSLLESITISQLEMPAREHSPVSSESRSDLVKIGSDHTSGHTSGDELETTTSSDIEIISSPNGDSSSTQSRQSPAKQTCMSRMKHDDPAYDMLLCKMTMKKAKGHTRELSEASSISDDSHSSEVDRLRKRISEMAEILESRESKLIDVSRMNAELQEMNRDYKNQLDTFLTKQFESADVSQVTEEYTQRLSALEKKFQQAIRERDGLRKQLEQSKQDAAMRMSKGELESLISEKDSLISELREEGEKLSRTQLQHSTIIKKLRAKEKESESTIKHFKETVDSLTTESDRLKKSLSAKDEVERTQIEAVHNLTSKNKKLETEVQKLQSQLDDLTQKYDTAKKSLDAAKKELVDKNRTSSELHAREKLLENLESQKKMTESQNEEMINQLESLRQKLRQSDQDYLKKEQTMKRENNDVLQRLEEAEARNEELSQSILEVTKPLMRQLESLQVTHNMKVASFEKLEQEFSSKISDLQTKLQTSKTSERTATEESLSLRSKLADIEGRLSSFDNQQELLKMQVEQQKAEKQISEQELKSEISNLKDLLKIEKEKVENQVQEIGSLQRHLESNENERKKSMLLQENLMEKSDHPRLMDRTSPNAGSNSPTLSLGKVSVADSVGSSFWSQEEPFDISHTPRYTNMFEMQMLQTNLKQKDGELQQLQWELNRREQERSLLNTEISSLLTRVEEIESKGRDYDNLKTQFEEVQQQYDTLCQLYGEKVEENEELKLDLLDVKEMYKGQIDELLRQQRLNKN